MEPDMSSGIVPVVLAMAVILVGVYFLANQASLDLASPVRNWLWERDARRMKTRKSYPAAIDRYYWTAREFEKDAARLEALGYVRTSETQSDPYITLPDVGLRRGRPPPRRRVPMFHVTFEHRAPPGSSRP
jgi:hypothetical protein